jgi:hypothetical protein
VTVPLVLLVGLLLGLSGLGQPSAGHSPSPGAPLPTLTVSAPARSDAATVSTCAQVISALPLRLQGQALRLTVSRPPSPSIVAWGDPAIVLRCGVAKPPELTPQLASSLFQVNHSVTVLPKKRSGATVFTVVDRVVYIDVTVPSSYRQPPLGPIADAIASVLPRPVCSTDPAEPDPDRLCTRRK